MVAGHPHRVRVGGAGAGPQLAGSLQGRTADGHVAGHNTADLADLDLVRVGPSPVRSDHTENLCTAVANCVLFSCFFFSWSGLVPFEMGA